MIALLWLAACGVPVERTASPDAVLPHPADYDEAQPHGSDALEPGASCLQCHAIQAVKQVEPLGGAPACQVCHEDYPHTDGYGLTDGHGAAWLVPESTCEDCHGDGTIAPSGVAAGACTSCHHTYPHVDGWDEAAAHGAAVLARGGHVACLSCHVESGTGGPETGTCASCHAIYPHPVDFALPTLHGPAWEVDDGASCTSTCHPPSAATPPPEVACTSCHDLFPHAEGWPDGHIREVQVRGEAACARCHEPGTPVAPAMPVSCGASCHAGGAP